MPEERFLFTAILRVLRDTRVTGAMRGLSTREIYQILSKNEFASHWYFRFSPRTKLSERVIDDFLADLRDADFVRNDAAQGFSERRWRLNSIPEQTFDGGAGQGNQPPQGGDGGGTEREEGGLREVLSHPFLFSLDQEDFESAIERSIGAGQ
jgi:hypothetical protein